jgi:hypothetical protein
MDDIDRHPELDTTEGIIRIMSNSMLQTLASTKQEDWKGMDMDKLLKEANALTRVTAQKRRVDMQNRSTLESAVEGNKQQFYDMLSTRSPGLYQQLLSAINQMADDFKEDDRLSVYETVSKAFNRNLAHR